MTKDSQYSERLCFFGIGALFNECFEQLVMASGRRPDFLCDNAREKWGKEFFGVKCISPTELEKMPDKKSLVITVRNYENIYEQLRKMRIDDISISCYERTYDRVKDLKKLNDAQVCAPCNIEFKSPVRGKWTLVTGASRGIGRQIALGMAEQGANIIVHARSLENAEKVVGECSALGVEAAAAAAELSDLNAVDAMLEKLNGQVPSIDILFNNAGISPPCASGFWNMPDKDFLDAYRVNALAPIHICRRLLPLMIKRGWGRAINITSSIQKRPGEMAYACSKAALDKFSHDLAPSLQDTGVMISQLDPGWLQTDMGGDAALRPVESVVPGALLGALLKENINGFWFSAQDYAGLSIQEAIKKAKFIYGLGHEA